MLRSILRKVFGDQLWRLRLQVSATAPKLVAGGEPGKPRGYWKNDQNCENGNARPNPESRTDGRAPLGVASETPPRQVTWSVRALAGQMGGEL